MNHPVCSASDGDLRLQIVMAHRQISHQMFRCHDAACLDCKWGRSRKRDDETSSYCGKCSLPSLNRRRGGVSMSKCPCRRLKGDSAAQILPRVLHPIRLRLGTFTLREGVTDHPQILGRLFAAGSFHTSIMFNFKSLFLTLLFKSTTNTKCGPVRLDAVFYSTGQSRLIS